MKAKFTRYTLQWTNYQNVLPMVRKITTKINNFLLYAWAKLFFDQRNGKLAKMAFLWKAMAHVMITGNFSIQSKDFISQKNKSV